MTRYVVESADETCVIPVLELLDERGNRTKELHRAAKIICQDPYGYRGVFECYYGYVHCIQ